MCKQGDIILIKKYKDHDLTLPQHSFVVIDDERGFVQGLPFDFVALVMSSFKSEEQRKRKLRFPGNFPFSASDESMAEWANTKDGYIKAEQFYYFSKDKTDFDVIGELNDETWNLLVAFIESLAERGIPIDQIIDNL